MARSTCNPDAEVPEGMMKFEVIRSTIKDNVGQYCVPGDMAILTPVHAKGYLDMNYIRVPLPPGFADEIDDHDEDHSTLHEEGHKEPRAKGRAAARKAEVAAERERERAKQEAADAERERILEDAKAEAAQIIAEARAGVGPDTEAPETDSSGELEESPTGGETESPLDSEGEAPEERKTG